MHNEGKLNIIESAQRLIAKHGVDKTSMRNIAEEAGITTGAIYYYYKSKEELLYDVMDYSTAITSNIMQMRQGASVSSEKVLDEIARLVVRRLVGDKSSQRLRYYLAYQAALGDETLRERFANDYSGQAKRTSELFNFVFGTDPNPNDLYLAVIMIAALDGINLQQFIGALPVDIEELARIYLEFFAYAVPLFEKNSNDLHRFDFLKMKPDELE
jgi:AcrR family transcriptional regulator